ncbi:hypothetical protein F4804DRAFT_350117 [Jackrogersella minutella]|nr:hypothetical protein F4804DRAFT_350117 [Jackrogersella minutella]
MSSKWASCEREWIQKTTLNNTGNIARPSVTQEYGIQLITEILNGSKYLDNGVADEITSRMIRSGQPLKEAWDEFLLLIFSAAMSTSNDDSQKNLTKLVSVLAHHGETQPIGNVVENESDVAEVGTLLSSLAGFGWIARDYWNGPMSLLHRYGTPNASQRAWVNLNRFMAHLSCQDRRIPMEPLHGWVEDFGLWTIADGLEDPAGMEEHAEAAAAWLVIAGTYIYNDPIWGHRDGSTSLGVPLREGRLWRDSRAAGSIQGLRCNFWKYRLQTLVDDEASDASVRDLAKDAIQAMEKLESPP